LDTTLISKLTNLIRSNHPYSEVIPVCAQLEVELLDLSEEDRRQYLLSLGLEKSALERLIQVCFRQLNLITFFTILSNEVRAWSIPGGTLAPAAAGVIHSDFEKGFIKAEVCCWCDLLKIGSWQQAKNKGKIRIEGKDYKLQDGDVVIFRFNT